MNLENIVATFPTEVRESPSMKGILILIQTLQEQLTKAQEKISVLENELTRLRKTPKKPKFRSPMEPRNRKKRQASDPSPPALAKSTLVQKEISEIKIELTNRPEGSRFKGYQSFSVQEIGLIAKEITYKLAVWQSPSGEILRAKLPQEIQGSHYGPTLRALAANLYAQGMTQPGIHEFLEGIGFELSEGQVSHILLNEAEGYSQASEAILKAGLEEAPYIRTDDTGEKHQHKDSYCTHIGGQHFAYYTTSSSKSRLNFLRILLQGKEGYCINEAMIWHLFQCGVKDDILNLFELHTGKQYQSKKGMHRLLNGLGIENKKLREQCLEAGLVGFISSTILKPGQILLSDRAGQFAVFDHAGCWVHMERPLRKIICTSKQAEDELKQVRGAIWDLYDRLKEASLTQEGKETVHKMYDALVGMKTMSSEINAVIANFAAYRDEMLKALEHPGLPLHNNDSERDIRGVAKRRNISGSTKSDLGRKFRDGLLSIKQTCFRLGYNFWEYLQWWHRGDPPDLAELVRTRYGAATS
jgi:Transposase IS66 family